MAGDPYTGCEKDCTHDLAAGVRVTDLRSGDGGFRSPFLEPRGGAVLAAHMMARSYDRRRRVTTATPPPQHTFPD